MAIKTSSGICFPLTFTCKSKSVNCSAFKSVFSMVKVKGATGANAVLYCKMRLPPSLKISGFTKLSNTIMAKGTKANFTYFRLALKLMAF